MAMVYDENGRAYVVEMNDYPFVDPASRQSVGRSTVGRDRPHPAA
ncbi:MAG: hypothetical protein U0992_12360 [Planctomycetaceae bacterium]